MPVQDYDQAVDALRKLPEDKQRLVLGKLTPEARKGILSHLSGPQNFTDNPKGEGLYRMSQSPASEGEQDVYTSTTQPEIQVPFGRVQDALNAGYRLHFDEKPRFQKDQAHQGEGPTLLEKANTKVQSMLAPSGGKVGNLPVGIAPMTVDQVKAAGRTLYSALPYLGSVLIAAKKMVTGEDQGDELLNLLDPSKLPEGLYNQFTEDWKKDKNLAVNNLIGSIEGMGAAAVLTHGATEAVKGIPKLPGAESARGAIRDTLGVTENTEKVVDKFGKESADARKVLKAERQKAVQGNIEEQRKIEEERQKIKEHNDAVMRDENKREATKRKLNDASEQLERKIETAKKKAKAANDKAWAAWRKKVAGTETSSTPIVDEIHNVKSRMNPEDVAEFRKILKEATPTGEDMSERQRLRDDIARDNKIGDNYESLTPANKKAVDTIIERLNLDPDTPDAGEGGEAGTEGGGGTKPISAERLHVWKTQLEYAIRSAKRESVRGGIGQVLDKVRETEADLSKQAGAEEELDKARALHAPYVETFRNPRYTPNTVANYVKAKVTPEFTKDSSLESGIEMLGKYDPSIPQTISHIDNLQQGLKSLPKEGPLRDKLKVPPPLPSPESLPTETSPVPFGETKAKGAQPKVPNIQAENIEYINNGLRKYGKVGGWVLRLIAGGLAEHLAHGSVSVFSGNLLIGQTAVTLLTKALRSPSMLEWLAKPSAEDLKLIESLPPEDAARMRQAIGALTTEEVRSNPSLSKTKIAPAMAAWLAGRSVGQGPKSIDDVKKEGEERQKESSLQHEDAKAEIPPELERIKKALHVRLKVGKPYGDAVASVGQNEPNVIEINDPKRFAQGEKQTISHELTHLLFNNLAGPVRAKIPPDNARFPYDISHVDELRKKGYKLWNLPQEVAATVVQTWVANPSERERLQPWIEDFNDAPLSVEEPTPPGSSQIVMSIRPPLPPPQTAISPEQVKAKAAELQHMFHRAGMAR